MQRKNNNKVLVPIDFSDLNAIALSHAIKVALTYGNELVLIHIMEQNAIKSLFVGEDNVMREFVKTKLGEIAAKIETENKIKVSFQIAEGKPYKTIAQLANEENFDCIIMGSHGASGMGQIVGSNASRTIQYSQVPVVVVKNSTIGEQGYQKIVMPIDLSLETRQKAEWAIHLGTKFDSEIVILYENSEDDYLKSRINGNLREVTKKLEASKVKYQIVEIEDSLATNFATETLAKANELNADLILVMTHTDKSLGEMIIGTLTQQLVNKSQKIPVMCIHPKEIEGFTYSY